MKSRIVSSSGTGLECQMLHVALLTVRDIAIGEQHAVQLNMDIRDKDRHNTAGVAVEKLSWYTLDRDDCALAVTGEGLAVEKTTGNIIPGRRLG